jgi:predicted TIM-barrel fold metal-dependent hydrolase
MVALPLVCGAILLAGCNTSDGANNSEPIIDVHLHAMLLEDSDPPNEHFCLEYLTHAPTIDPIKEPLLSTLAEWRQDPDCPVVVKPAESDEANMVRTIQVLRDRNIIGIVGGPRELVAKWHAAEPEHIIPSRNFFLGRDTETPEELAAAFAAGEIKVLGEVGNQYFGYAPNAPEFEPYWAMAEANDIPVGIHIGYMPPGAGYWEIGARISLGDPLLLEEVLIKYPKLRVYIMHSGYPQVERTIALMQAYPQVYSDTGMLHAILTKRGYEDFLARMFDAGLGTRLMFGTDQIIWPDMIEIAIGMVESSRVLNDAQKRDLLYNNAARFFRIDEHGRIN